MDDVIPDAAGIAGMLADETRRRVVAALVLGASTIEEIRDATGLGVRAVASALARLVEGELVVRGDDGTHALLGDAFRRAAIAAAPSRPETALGVDVPEDAAKVLRTFVRDGRLVSIPAQRAKRLPILDLLAQELEPGRRYREREVNALLRKYHDDVASLRRYLVDEGYVDRAGGEYWRSGGSVR